MRTTEGVRPPAGGTRAEGVRRLYSETPAGIQNFSSKKHFRAEDDNSHLRKLHRTT
ncbi:hypothetical protein KIN20_029550 [Parelaphostrongylus tenuis]|uniref:Uncharacterized protein n=1 Tax=Parelaphostrongylus tenuis TaxID=148309 RepID=A0AAD5WG65_PARTN|nr:hypothetical protein KIN20_029550 [Parelaphostrongylus tenuis]